MSNDLTAIDWMRDGVNVRVVVETPRGSHYKYAYDSDAKALGLHFMIARGLSWPYDFGFVPQTLCDDGDPADMMLIMEEAVIPLATVNARLIGGFEMTKDGIRNDRLVACPLPMKGVAIETDRYQVLDDLPPDDIAQIEEFLQRYSEEQGHEIKIQRRYGPDEAKRYVKDGHQRWKKNR